jgi:endoribonuclease Dicer
MVHRELVTSVFGDSGRYAKERASKKASHELQGMTVKEFKAKFGCDCKAAEECESADVKMENGVTV